MAGVAPPADGCAGVASHIRGVAFGFGVASPAGARPGVSSHMFGAFGVAAEIAPTPPKFIFFFGPPAEGVSPPSLPDRSIRFFFLIF